MQISPKPSLWLCANALCPVLLNRSSLDQTHSSQKTKTKMAFRTSKSLKSICFDYFREVPFLRWILSRKNTPRSKKKLHKGYCFNRKGQHTRSSFGWSLVSFHSLHFNGVNLQQRLRATRILISLCLSRPFRTKNALIEIDDRSFSNYLLFSSGKLFFRLGISQFGVTRRKLMQKML